MFARAVVWGLIDVNPAKLGVDNPSPRRREQRPFESWAELDAVAANLAPRYRPMVIFAAATGLRPAEWLALERRDLDPEARVLYVRRSFTKGRLKRTKTEASLRAVPLQAMMARPAPDTQCLTAGRLNSSYGRGWLLSVVRNFRSTGGRDASI